MPLNACGGLRRLGMVLAIVAAPFSGALAVGPTDSLFGGQGYGGLSQADLDHMNTAAALLYEGTPGRTVERWTSPATGRSGEIRLISSFEFRGMPCRRLDYTITAADQSNLGHYVMSWCRVPDGAWKMVEVPASH